MTKAQRNAEIAKMATEFMQFLDNNCGYGADWPVSLSDRALYRRPPELKR